MILGPDALVLDRATRELVYLPVEADRDLDTLTLEVAFGDGGFETWAWAGPATTRTTDTGQQLWQRTGRRMVAGPDNEDPGDALVLPVALYRVRWYVKGGSESPVRRTTPIEIA